MAILFSQADGSDQHYDTYEEFEQAFILMKRLNGEEVPQDLLDEVKAKHDVKDPTTIQMVDGDKFESAFREATRELVEALDEVAENRTPVSDECENSEKEPKFKVGDKVRVVSAEDGTNTPYHGFTIGSNVEVKEVCRNGKVEAHNGTFHQTLLPHHYEKVEPLGKGANGEEVEDSMTEFRNGDIVRATEDVVGFGGQYFECNAGNLLEVQIGGSGAMCLVKDFWKIAYVSENLANIELVCRREDRKDIEL